MCIRDRPDTGHPSLWSADCTMWSAQKIFCFPLPYRFPPVTTSLHLFVFIRNRTKQHYNPKSDYCQPIKRYAKLTLPIVSFYVSLYNNLGISSGRSAVRPYRQCLGSPYWISRRTLGGWCYSEIFCFSKLLFYIPQHTTITSFFLYVILRIIYWHT